VKRRMGKNKGWKNIARDSRSPGIGTSPQRIIRTKAERNLISLRYSWADQEDPLQTKSPHNLQESYVGFPDIGAERGIASYPLIIKCL